MSDPSAPSSAPAGWFPDPEGAGNLRYWDGLAWTEHRSPTPAPRARGSAPEGSVVAPAVFRIVGALLVAAGVLQLAAVAGSSAVAIGASIAQGAVLIGVFAVFLWAGFPHRGIAPRVLSLAVIALYALALLALLGAGVPAVVAVQSLLGLGVLGVGIAFGIVTLRTRGYRPGIALLPLSLYLLLLFLGLGASRVRADGALYLPAIAYLLVGILFVAFARSRPSVPAVESGTPAG